MEIKVLILYNRLWTYRIPIFKLLAKQYDLTVTYSLGKKTDELFPFKVDFFPVWKMGRFVIHRQNLKKICNNYDVVIGYGDIAWLSIMRLSLMKKRNFKIIYWTIGVRASYTTKYGSKTFWDNVRYYFMAKADALLFYSDFPISRCEKRGIDKEKIFVANNTVEVLPIEIKEELKDSLLFIGTLYKEKGIFNLLFAYQKAKSVNPDIPKLIFIGGGEGLNDISSWVQKNSLSDSIVMKGPIYDEKILALFFQRAIATISPNQAGLSVLKSMGYGVPFITSQNSITGGEIFNIKNNFNGLLFDDNDDEALVNIILDTYINPNKFVLMGKNALNHYYNYRKPEDMSNSIADAIKYVLKTNCNNLK